MAYYRLYIIMRYALARLITVFTAFAKCKSISPTQYFLICALPRKPLIKASARQAQLPLFLALPTIQVTLIIFYSLNKFLQL